MGYPYMQAGCARELRFLWPDDHEAGVLTTLDQQMTGHLAALDGVVNIFANPVFPSLSLHGFKRLGNAAPMAPHRLRRNENEVH